jgi:hypothetical protein
MKTIAAAALCLWPVHYVLYLPYYRAISQFNGMMADFCEAEETLMRQRCNACYSRASQGLRWDDTSEEDETLKLCPYPDDTPGNGSWMEQSAVWDRAAQRAMRMAKFYANRAG